MNIRELEQELFILTRGRKHTVEIEAIKANLQRERERLKKQVEANKKNFKKEKEEKENMEFWNKIQRIMAERQKSLSPFRPSKPSVDRGGSKSTDIQRIKDLYDKYKNEWSELSITFQQLYRVNFDNETIRDILQETIKEYYEDIEVLLIPEFGDNNNLHFHGFIKGKKSKLSALKSNLTKYYGRTSMKQITYRDSYLNYLLKEEENQDIYNRFIISNIY